MTARIDQEVWQSTRSLVDCNRYMLENQCQCDVTFLLVPSNGVESSRISAHKYVLMARSPVFMAMFTGPLAEHDDVIKVTDVSSECFKALLRYLYTEEVDLNEDCVFGILYAAKKYLVGGLIEKILSFLKASLKAENVCIYLDNSFLLEDHPELLAACSDLIQRQSQTVFHSEPFFQMTRESLCQILQMSRLTIPEIDVFRACEHWAKQKCVESQLAETPKNMRELLGKALYHLHLPVLELEQFSSIVVKSGLLSTEEENAVFRHLLAKQEKDAEQPQMPFPATVRSFVAGRAVISYPDGFVKHTTSFTSLFQGLPQRSRWSMAFQCDHTFKLIEIGLLGSFRGTLAITQGGERKLEITTHAHTQRIKLGEQAPLLDGGTVFTISSESPFSYSGEYYSRARGDFPGIICDHHQVTVVVRDSSSLCFLGNFLFMPTDELHFIDNYYSEVVEEYNS